eukprot:295193_1
MDDTVPNTQEAAKNDLSTGYDDKSWSKYFWLGFSFVQDSVDTFILSQLNSSYTPPNFVAQPFPTPAYTSDLFATFVADVLGLFFTLAFMWVVTRIVKDIVEEKEFRIKEGMKMMGLSDSVVWLAHLSTQSILFALTCILIV